MRASQSLSWGLLILAIATSGCSCAPQNANHGNGGGGDGGQPSEAKEFKLGDLIEPHDPPPATLADVDKAAGKWIDQPVLDALAIVRDKQKGEKSAATVAEALALPNDSEENNTKIVSALGRVAQSDDEVNFDASITRHLTGDVKSVNPILASSVQESDILTTTAFGLFSFDAELYPHASKETVVSWQVSEDRLYDKVVIRDDLVWSDGQPITAHDVEFSFKAILTDAVPALAQRSGTDKLKWVKAYDDHTLVYCHKDKAATNVWNLNFMVIPKHIYEKSIAEDPTMRDSAVHVKLEDEPIVGGPYKITKRLRNREIVMERREDWYMHKGKQVRDKPYFKNIVFRVITDPSVALLALKKGEIEEQELQPEQWQSLATGPDFYEKNTKARGVEWTYFYFGYNVKTPFFEDVRVRHAMSLTFDHQRLLSTLRYGLDEACYGNFHPESIWAPKPWPPTEPEKFFNKRDLDRAEALFDEAGWTIDEGTGIRTKEIDGQKVPFSFTLLVRQEQWRVDIANLFRQNLEQVGIKCNVQVMELVVMQEKLEKHEYQAAFGGWGAGADPDTSVNLWGTNEPRNFGQYSNKKVDELFESARKEFDLEKRAAMYGEIQRILYADQPYTWLFYRTSLYGFNKQLRGFNFSPRGPYHYSPGFGSIFKPSAM